MRYVFLSSEFYANYPKAVYPEIEQKQTRPYAQVALELGDCVFAIPLRSNINHLNAYFTNKDDKCGLDFSKTVVILKKEYIDSISPQIRQNEFNFLKGKEHIVKNKLQKYINRYKDAKQNQHIIRNQLLLKYSTLQYFDEFI